jgi:hypothetical protein
MQAPWAGHLPAMHSRTPDINEAFDFNRVRVGLHWPARGMRSRLEYRRAWA